MKFTETAVAGGIEILANSHYTAIPYDCTELSNLAQSGVIPAGTVIPSNDAQALGVLLSDVVLDENPNGTVVIRGCVNKDKLPTAPDEAAVTALKDITFLPFDEE